jgi:hybrid polyketide synthase/nonribosomal peptide synthetase ACE1
MRKILHLSSDYEFTTSVRTDELGLDSLTAVRIRSWFLNNFQVNIPALRILKGIALQELIQQAVEDIPDEITPKLKSLEDPVQEVEPSFMSGHTSNSHDSRSDTPLSSNHQTDSSTPQEELVVLAQKHEVQQEFEPQRLGRLSFTQSVFLFVHELLNDKSTLNNTGMLHLRGEIRMADLAKAVEALGQRHEALRTCIFEQHGKLVQGVLKSSSLVLENKRVYSREDVSKAYESLRNHVYDLPHGKTSRILVLSYSSTDHYLLMGSHHIVFDRASNDVVMTDLEMAYNGLKLRPDPLQYLTYSNQQHDMYLSGAWKQAVKFWCREFGSLPEPLALHRSQVSERQPLVQYNSHMIEFKLDRQVSGKIRDVARKYRSTPFHLHLAAFKVLLHRFLGTKDVCIGIADNCRGDDYMRTGIGPFLNMLPLRMNASSEQPFAEAITESREKSLLALTNSIPFEIILNELHVTRPSTHTPLAQAFLNYAENDVEDGQSFLGCQMETMNQNPAEIPYDITFTIVNNTSGDTQIILNVQKSLYSKEESIKIAHGYEDILSEFSDTPEERIGDEWKFRKPVLEQALSAGRGKSFNRVQAEWLICHISRI